MLSRFCLSNLRVLFSPVAIRGLSKHQISASSASSGEDTQVVVADDGRTLVCWHPEREFPYEHTLPIPEKKAAQKNIIKALDEEDTFKNMKEELVREKLMKMTYTTKHRWFPRLQKKKAKKTPMDRPYL